MIEVTPEGFKILKGMEGVDTFMINSERINECIAYVKSHDIRFIGLNSFIDFKTTDISFLEELVDFVEGLLIPEDFYNLSVINKLYRLKFLGFADNKNTVIDLSNFPDLETLGCNYTKRLRSLESCEQLRHLSLTGYKSNQNTVEDLPQLLSLRCLSLYQTNIKSLDGFSRFPNLERLDIFRASQLVDISGLKEVGHKLNSVEIDVCKKIQSYDVLGRLPHLKRLLISKSAPIESLAFIKQLDNLEFLSFVGTNIVDGDISPAIGLDYVGFDDKRHYSHKFKEILGT